MSSSPNAKQPTAQRPPAQASSSSTSSSPSAAPSPAADNTPFPGYPSSGMVLMWVPVSGMPTPPPQAGANQAGAPAAMPWPGMPMPMQMPYFPGVGGMPGLGNMGMGMGMAQFRAADEEPAKEKVYTPMEKSPWKLRWAARSCPEKDGLAWIGFPCPTCHQPQKVSRMKAGLLMRCADCLSVISAANPNLGQPARSMENDVSALLFEDQPKSDDQHRMSLTWDQTPGRRRKQRSHLRVQSRRGRNRHWKKTLFAAAAVLVGISVITGSKFAHRGGKQMAASVGGNLPSDLAERAEATVRAFSVASSEKAVAQLVSGGLPVACMVGDHYARWPEQALVPAGKIKSTGLSYYQDDGISVPVSPVLAQCHDGMDRLILVEHRPEGDVIEWQASVGASPGFDWTTCQTSQGTPAVIRAEAVVDTYPNFAFDDPAAHICLRLTSPSSSDGSPVYGYMPRTAENTAKVRSAFTPGQKRARLTLKIEPIADSVQTRQVKILGIESTSWRTVAENQASE